MFTGLVETTGSFLNLQDRGDAWRLRVAGGAVVADTAVGDSVAVNGCCLTVTGIEDETLAFDLLGETLRLTNLGSLEEGAPVNLERSLRADGRLGGHFVTGHIDVKAPILEIEPRGKDRYLRIGVPGRFSPYLAYKGSIAVDGVSLTVAEVSPESFAIWLIPHTIEVTNLGTRRPGHDVNLEFDLLAKYAERLLAVKPSSDEQG